MAVSGNEMAGGVAQLITLVANYSYYGVLAVRAGYAEHKASEKAAEIAAINDLYIKRLTNITVSGPGATERNVSLPEIFVEDPKGVFKSSFLNEAALNDLENEDPKFDDARLLEYGAHIQAAMLRLRSFYESRIQDRGFFSKGKDDDVTSSVISYLILNISTYCYKFTNHARTIAVLKGIISFVNDFASLHGEKSDRFEKLTLVWKELVSALFILEKNSLQLSYSTTLNEITPGMQTLTKKLFRYLLQLITPNKHWKLIQFILADDIVEGILKPQFNHSHTGVVSDPEIPIPDCIFKEWLQQSARHYLVAIKINDKEDDKGSEIGNNKFDFSSKTKEQKKIEIKKIAEVFKHSKNFFTHYSKKVGKSYVWAPLDKEIQTIEWEKRIGLFADFLTLTEMLNSVIYFCGHMSRRVLQLGEIYVSNPQNCVFLFEVLKGMGTQIEVQSGRLKLMLEEIAVMNATQMSLGEIQDVYDNIIKTLTNINVSCVKSIKELYDKHKKYPGMEGSNAHRGTVRPSKDIMLNIANKMKIEYRIDTSVKAEVEEKNVQTFIDMATALKPQPTLTRATSSHGGPKLFKRESSLEGGVVHLRPPTNVSFEPSILYSKSKNYLEEADEEDERDREEESKLMNELDNGKSRASPNPLKPMSPSSKRNVSGNKEAKDVLYEDTELSDNHKDKSIEEGEPGMPKTSAVMVENDEPVTIDTLLIKLHIKIEKLKDEQSQGKDSNVYELYNSAYHKIKDMNNHAIELVNMPEIYHRIKGKKTQGMLFEVCHDLLDFLDRDDLKRKVTADRHFRILVRKLDSHHNMFLDEYPPNKYFSASLNFFRGKTKSRIFSDKIKDEFQAIRNKIAS